MFSLRSILANVKKGQSALTVRHILNALEQSYLKMQGDIAISGCQKHSEDATTVYLTMPSESTKGVFYDIVMWLRSTKKITLDTSFKAYSNSPAFAYNFAYVFNKAGSLLFPEKYSTQFKNMPPKIRNPYMSAGFDRHIFSAIRYISDYKLPRVIGQYDGTTPSIKSFDQKIREVRDIKDELRRSQLAR